jgi:hypothetical protein
MSNKELLNYFPIDPFSKKTHQVLGVGLLEQPNVYLPFLIVFEFADIRISYQLLLRLTRSFSCGLLTKERYSFYILPKVNRFRFLFRSVGVSEWLEETVDIQARCFL